MDSGHIYVPDTRWGIYYPRTMSPIPVGAYMLSAINMNRSVEQLTRPATKPTETKNRSYIFCFVHLY